MFLLFNKLDQQVFIFGKRFGGIYLVFLGYVAAIVYYFILISLFGFANNLKFVGFIDLFIPVFVYIVGGLSIIIILFSPFLVFIRPEIWTENVYGSVIKLLFTGVVVAVLHYLIKQKKLTTYLLSDFIVYNFGILVVISYQGV